MLSIYLIVAVICAFFHTSKYMDCIYFRILTYNRWVWQILLTSLINDYKNID